jgi:hypothetical protein
MTQNLFNGFATASAVRTAHLNKELALITLFVLTNLCPVDR